MMVTETPGLFKCFACSQEESTNVRDIFSHMIYRCQHKETYERLANKHQNDAQKILRPPRNLNLDAYFLLDFLETTSLEEFYDNLRHVSIFSFLDTSPPIDGNKFSQYNIDLTEEMRQAIENEYTPQFKAGAACVLCHTCPLVCKILTAITA